MFVVTPVSKPTHLAGIGHAHAVKHIQGAAVFGFRNPELALRFAYGIDDHLSIGQDVRLKCVTPPEGTKLYNVQVGKVDEDQIMSYCSALQISAVILDFSPSHDVLYVKEIVSPERDMAFSAGYLSHLFENVHIIDEMNDVELDIDNFGDDIDINDLI